MTDAPRASRGRRLLLWAPVTLLLAYEFYLSSLSVLPSAPSVLEFPQADKLVHASYFFLVATMAVRAARFGEGWSRHRTLVTIVAAALAYGMLDEFHQSFVPHRDVEALDVVADTLGALCAALFAEGLWRLSGLERTDVLRSLDARGPR